MTSLPRKASKGLFAGLDLFARPLSGPRLLIYHQIGGGSKLEMEVDPEAFHRQLDLLASRYEVVPLTTALDSRADDTVVLTFDDGYRSLYEIAYPLMAERGMSFTLYLTTEPVETGRPLRDHSGSDALTWEMIREMADSGYLTVGAHTHTHPDIRLIDRSTLCYELEQSDSLIEQRLGIVPHHFAYPWGYWSPETDAVIRGRYRSAALGSRMPWQASFDDHLIHRIPIQFSDGWVWFRHRIRRGLVFEEVVRRRLRGYSGP